jgi:AcrR family transcriptional regulator
MTAQSLTAPVTDETAPASRRERRKLEVRTRIIEAAVALFDEHGFHATNVEAIAERADVAYKTFFNHFPSKQALLEVIAREQLAVLLEMLTEAGAQPGTAGQRLTWFFRTLADRVESGGPMRRELVTEVIHVAHDAGTKTEQARVLHDAFARVLRSGVRAGDVPRTHSVETLTDVVVGVFYSLFFSWTNLPDYPFRKRALDAARFIEQAVSKTPRRNGR